MKRIPATTITLNRSETSPEPVTAVCTATPEQTVWQVANAVLTEWAETMFVAVDCFELCEFTVLFENGATYSSESDIKPVVSNSVDLGLHLINEWEQAAGRWRPPWMRPTEYEEYLDDPAVSERRHTFTRFLNDYEIG